MRLPATYTFRDAGNGPVVTSGTGFVRGAESGIVALR
jgi:hypothetical protein